MGACLSPGGRIGHRLINLSLLGKCKWRIIYEGAKEGYTLC